MDQLQTFTSTPPTNGDFETMYRYRRVIEWLSTSEFFLTDLLQPGFFKSTRRISFGSIDHQFFIDFMNQFRFLVRTRQPTRATYINEQCVQIRGMSFKFSLIDGLPPLIRPDWYVKFITTEYPGPNSELPFDYAKSIFTTITFTINLDNNLVDYSFCTQSFRFVDGRWTSQAIGYWRRHTCQSKDQNVGMMSTDVKDFVTMALHVVCKWQVQNESLLWNPTIHWWWGAIIETIPFE